MKKLFLILVIIIGGKSAFATKLTSNEIVINNQPIHYYKIGQGSPLILLTGYAVTANFWSKPFINCLAQSKTVYIFDYPGINTLAKTKPNLSITTLAKEVNQIIQQLNLPKPQLVAWSMGGAVALEVANTYPQAISQMFLISPLLPTFKVIKPMPPKPQFHCLNDVLNYVFTNNLYNYKASKLNSYKSQILFSDKALFVNASQNAMEQKAINQWISNPSNLANLKHNTIKTTFILASKDAMLNPLIQTKVLNNYPNGTIVIIQNSGHAIFYQASKQVCNIITK